ncbi:cytochrome P450 [Azohydromonas caseinilytica]|uniref:Cytochrome P450 n=1 Tax=Azohydromonas caseinilytica TaxID=2728836 RepID=A0A848F8H8_9BURK|nr:cytochrome P450 [Azohydromonas caseinilytica]NML15864.1 cytochrome P450 [Azohydromonas caseinilytica]
MRPIPRVGGWDSSLEFLGDPYRFIHRHCLDRRSDVVEARLMLRATLCFTGPRAAELFYNEALFLRAGAAPEPVRATLFGKGGVQTLDGARHRRRKALFMRALAPEQLAALARQVSHEWEHELGRWAQQPPFSLYCALHPLLTRAVCHWAGVPLAPEQVELRSGELVALFDRAIGPPLQHLHARVARMALESWLAHLLSEARAGRVELPEGCAAETVALHRDEDGNVLRPHVAAVELINLLRPTVAVSVFITQAAHALHVHPECREPLSESLLGGDMRYAQAFVQEVRRWYPFFPAVAARVRHDFEWQGYHFPRGQLALLDLYGTDHDARSWDKPEAFRPQRFLTRRPGAYDLIPQGGAEPHAHHRCPGEGVAIALMLLSLDWLLHRMRWEVPPQDLELDMSRLPALPRGGFVIGDVQALP